MPETPNWTDSAPCAITICDKEGNVLYMNNKARETFSSHGDLIGKNLKDCHSPASWEKILDMLSTGATNSYTIDKQGQKKMIYQMPWKDETGEIAGLVEISMVIPKQMPNFQR